MAIPSWGPVPQFPIQIDAEKVITMVLLYAFHVDRILKSYHGKDAIDAFIQGRNTLQCLIIICMPE